MCTVARILLLADSHLGFDLPVLPRIRRRRRGHDFLANYATALAPALAGEVDIVVHAGDVFDRSSVHPTLAYQAFEPLRRIADRGIPVFIVPGNHERSRLPHTRFLVHPGIHVFESPRTFVTEVRGVRVALAGFPYERDNVRTRFGTLLNGTRWHEPAADLHLLCMHHCVEGATVGPANHTFRNAPDVICPRDVPARFAAVFSGHIHRHQVLTMDLAHRRLAAPVLYPGSIERTSFAEIGEPKGFMMVQIDARGAEPDVRWQFRTLPARPMMRTSVSATGMTASALAHAVDAMIADAPRDAVLTIGITGALTAEQRRALSAARLRTVAPETMNVTIGTTTLEGFHRRSTERGVAHILASR